MKDLETLKFKLFHFLIENIVIIFKFRLFFLNDPTLQKLLITREIFA